MSRIVWLASYPKSGNTWLRLVFANLLHAGDAPVNINSLDRGGLNHSALRRHFDESVGYEASNLAPDEVDAIRPDWYRHAAAVAKGPLLCKVHDACTTLSDGRLLFPPDATAGAIYVIRNPLDVCVSFAHHTGRSDHAEVVDAMADPDCALAAGPHDLPSQLRQRLLTWSEHVRSWADTDAWSVHVLRYEDMHAAPVDTFARAAAFAGIQADCEAVTRAVRFSAIEELQRQERERGFRASGGPARPFFRKGTIGSWREKLSDALAARIISDHGNVMRRFGYLTNAGEPVY